MSILDRASAAAIAADMGLVLMAGQHWLCDRAVVLTAMANHGGDLHTAAPELRADREVVLAAAQSNATALQWASVSLRSDRHIVLQAVKRSGHALAFASGDLKADRYVVLEAVQNAGSGLQHAAPKLRSEPSVVIAATRQDRRAAKYAIGYRRQDAVEASQTHLATEGETAPVLTAEKVDVANRQVTLRGMSGATWQIPIGQHCSIATFAAAVVHQCGCEQVHILWGGHVTNPLDGQRRITDYGVRGDRAPRCACVLRDSTNKVSAGRDGCNRSAVRCVMCWMRIR